jgi:hypothetical protein
VLARSSQLVFACCHDYSVMPLPAVQDMQARLYAYNAWDEFEPVKHALDAGKFDVDAVKP